MPRIKTSGRLRAGRKIVSLHGRHSGKQKIIRIRRQQNKKQESPETGCNQAAVNNMLQLKDLAAPRLRLLATLQK
jgi:hypothetical protein